MKRSVAVITGSRAEYGVQQILLQAIEDDPALELQLMVTGSHLASEHGRTVDAIEADGLRITETIPILEAESEAMSGAIARGLEGFSRAFERHKPDLIVLAGDRYELLAAAIAANLRLIPIAHINGGELTEGAIDEYIRHALTKLSHFHFSSTELFRKRVIQMGEAPERVFNVGLISLDNLDRMEWLSREALEQDFGIAFSDTVILATYHPVTLGDADTGALLEPFETALKAFPQATLILTGANADTGGRAINERLQAYARERQGPTHFELSLGQHRYLSAMKHCDLVLGNSSSGILEAPSMGKPTVNIGERQQGRLKAASVLDCSCEADAIQAAIERALSPDFRAACRQVVSPYGRGQVSERIRDHLREVPLQHVYRKRFFDLDFELPEKSS